MKKVESFKIFTPFKNSDDESFFTFLFEKTIEKNKDFLIKLLRNILQTGIWKE